MKIEHVKIRRVAEGEDASAWKHALEDASWLAGAKVLKDEPGSSWVRRATILGKDVVVKCRLLNTVGRRVKAAVGMGHGDKQWRGADHLAAADMPCGSPLALLHAVYGGKSVELLVLNYVDGRSLLSVLDDVRRGRGPSVVKQHAVAVAVGGAIARLVRAGLWNRDTKPSNLIVTFEYGEKPVIVLIDLVGIQAIALRGMDDDLLVAEMLASLMIEPIGCGCRPRFALWMAALRSALDGLGWSSEKRAERHLAMQSMIEDVNSVLSSHADPRPKVNPLAVVDN